MVSAWRYFIWRLLRAGLEAAARGWGILSRQSTLNETRPVIYNVCNYQKPVDGQPAFTALGRRYYTLL